MNIIKKIGLTFGLFGVLSSITMAQDAPAPTTKMSKKEMQARILELEAQNTTLLQRLDEQQKRLDDLAANQERMNQLMLQAPPAPGKQMPNAQTPIRMGNNTIRIEEAGKRIDRDMTTVIVFEESEFDFGLVKEGDQVEHIFKFTNKGDYPLTITSARGSCGCTVPEYPKTPIPPGGEAEILVKFNSKGKRGQQAKTVTLVANTNPEETILRIKAQVK